MILSEEIKTLLYTARSDKDLALLVKAIKKYEVQCKALDAPRFAFEIPLMQLCYVLNKADLALELFMSEVLLYFLFEL
jgi:hypothetical protein